MSTPAVLFGVSLMLSLGLTPLMRAVGRRTQGDRTGIPRLGGTAIAMAFLAPILTLATLDAATVGLLACGAVVVLLGLYDDIVGIPPLAKLAVQAAVATGAYAAGFRIEWLTNPFGQPLALGVLAFPLTLIWIVGIVNALNLIDGLDGLAAGVALIALGGSAVLALQNGDVWLPPIAAALGGATVGFLVYNFYPATIYMGDSGSLLLGFVLAVTAIEARHKTGTAFTLLVPMVMLGLPILDTVLAVVRRARLRQPILRADRDHIHHRLVARGLSTRQTVLWLYGASCVLAAMAMGLAYASSAQAALAAGGLLALSYGLVRVLGYLRPRDAFTEPGSMPPAAAGATSRPPATTRS